MLMRTALFSLLFTLATVSSLSAQEEEQEPEPKKPQAVVEASIGETKNVHQCGQLFLAGQFTTGDISKISEAGIKRVITLRTEGEIDWDEKAALKAVGLDLIEVPFRGTESLTDEVFDEIRKLLADKETATLFHCGSANRVGGVWLPFRVLDEGVELETALQEAKKIGLRNPGYEKKALEYIKRKQSE